jgi:hypothetical protein
MRRNLKMLGLALVAVLAMSAVAAAAASTQSSPSSPFVPVTQLAVGLAVGCICALGAAGSRTGTPSRRSLLREGNTIRAQRARKFIVRGFLSETYLPQVRDAVFTQRSFTPRSQKKNPSPTAAIQANVQLQANSENDINPLIISSAMA